MYDNHLHPLLVQGTVPAAVGELEHAVVLQQIRRRDRAARRAAVLAAVARLRRQRPARVRLSTSQAARSSL